MDPTTDQQTPASAHPNVQDLFLNQLRRDRQAVIVHLMDGRTFDACITSFDKFAVVLDTGGVDVLVFKHAIATIEAPQTVASHHARSS